MDRTREWTTFPLLNQLMAKLPCWNWEKPSRGGLSVPASGASPLHAIACRAMTNIRMLHPCRNLRRFSPLAYPPNVHPLSLTSQPHGI